jgi:hypothetical protein
LTLFFEIESRRFRPAGDKCRNIARAGVNAFTFKAGKRFLSSCSFTAPCLTSFYAAFQAALRRSHVVFTNSSTVSLLFLYCFSTVISLPRRGGKKRQIIKSRGAHQQTAPDASTSVSNFERFRGPCRGPASNPPMPKTSTKINIFKRPVARAFAGEQRRKRERKRE